MFDYNITDDKTLNEQLDQQQCEGIIIVNSDKTELNQSCIKTDNIIVCNNENYNEHRSEFNRPNEQEEVETEEQFSNDRAGQISYQPKRNLETEQSFQKNNSSGEKVKMDETTKPKLLHSYPDKSHELDGNSMQPSAAANKSVQPQYKLNENSKVEGKRRCSASIGQNSLPPVFTSRKPRPNFIALPESNKPDLSQNEQRSIHSIIIQKNVEQHQNSSNIFKQTVDKNSEQNRQNYPQNNNILQANNFITDNVKAENNQNKQTDLHATNGRSIQGRDAACSFLTRVASRFLSPDGINSPCDSLCSLDSTPWNMEGTETIVENPSKKVRATASGLGSRPPSFVERELETLIEENKQLKASLEEAGRLNAQWRSYHQERQGYVERLLATVHTLQQRQISASPTNAAQKVIEGSGENREVQRLKETLNLVQAEHQEHVALLQMQVRAHRDDWEAESAEKKLEKTARQEAESRVGLLLLELQHLQQQTNEGYNNIHCNRCGFVQRTTVDNVVPLAAQIMTYNSSLKPNNDFNNIPQPNVSSATNIRDKYPINSIIVDKPTAVRNDYNCPTNSKELQRTNGHVAYHGNARQRNGFGVNSDLIKAHKSPTFTTSSAHQTGIDNRQKVMEVPLKGWIPVSMMHQIAFGGANDPRRLQYPNSFSALPPNNFSNDRALIPYQNCRSPPGSRESSLLSFTSSETASEPACFPEDNFPRNSYNVTGARPKSIQHQPDILEDDQRKAKHRARSILANAIPTSPVSSGPSTPAGIPQKTNIPITNAQINIPPISQSKNSKQLQLNNNITSLHNGLSKHKNDSRNFNKYDQKESSKSIIAKNNVITHNSDVYTIHPDKIHKVNINNKKHSKCKPDFEHQQLNVQNKSNRHEQHDNVQLSQLSDAKSPKPMTVHSHIKDCSPSNFNSPTLNSNHSQKLSPEYSPNPTFNKNHKIDNESSPINARTDQKSEKTRSPKIKKNQSPLLSNEKKVQSNNARSPQPNIDNSMKLVHHRSPKPEHKSPQPIKNREITENDKCNRASQIHSNSKLENCNLLEKNYSKKSQSEADLEVKMINANIIEQRNESMNCHVSRQISSSASNETSRSSSPGMSLTTFALTSEGRGIPGAICFSLHPEARSSVSSTKSPPIDINFHKKERSISEVHIETKSPNLTKSPIEISTKEHWWSVGETDHFLYPEKVEKSKNVSKVRNTSPPSNNMTTFLFTPAVNSSTSSSNLSSLNSSKTNSPPPQPTTHLKSIASKNIASAIISYEIAAKGDRIVYADRLKPTDVPLTFQPPYTQKHKPDGLMQLSPKKTSEENQTKPKPKPISTKCPAGVATITSKEIICPSCQMLFERKQHLLFLDHFETCRGPEFADL